MQRPSKVWRVLGGLAAGLANWGVWSLAGGEEPGVRAGLRVLFPADRSVVETGRFELIAVQTKEEASEGRPPLRVDGVEQPWERYRPPVLVAHLKLAPGPHQLQIGDRLMAVFAGGDPALESPEGWPVFRRHSLGALDKSACSSCHTLQGEEAGITVSIPQTPAACDRCHADSRFEAIHFHPKTPLAPCQMCHALHGSSRPALLKKSVKELCAACHE